MKKDIYKALSISNDIKAVSKGRIFQRLWNKGVMKIMRRLFK